MNYHVDNFRLIMVVCLVFNESKISEMSQSNPYGTIQVPIKILNYFLNVFNILRY